MNKEKETIADIAAEIRFAVKGCGDGLPYSCTIGDMRELADRIDAAAKREHSILHDSDKWEAFVQGQAAASYWRERCHDAEVASGNMAKMRDSLEHCRDYFYDLLQGVFLERQMAEQTTYPNMDDKKDESKLLQKIEEALAAPLVRPRNCDRFETAEDAIRAYEQPVSPRWAKDWTHADWISWAKWLFAQPYEGGPK